MHLIRFALFTVTAGLLALLFPGAGLVAMAKGGAGGKVSQIFDPLGAALGLHDVVTGGDAPDEPEVPDPTAPPATSPAPGPTAAETAAAEEADRLAKAEQDQELRRRRLTGETALTGPLGLTSSETFLTRRSLLG